MKLYFEILKLLVRKLILRQKTGKALKYFAESMGVTYIKFAQILAMQNVGNIFTEEDRAILSELCDHCSEIDFSEIKEVLVSEYGENFMSNFLWIDEAPLGSASISQVHRAKLKTGADVVLKVKRRDIATRVERDLGKIRKLMHRYGKLVCFKNYTGGDHALDLYLSWIREEVDFRHEIENLKKYHYFIQSVSGRLGPHKTICAPKLYAELSTDNIIVMEYVATPTVNRLTLDSSTKSKINASINNYIELSFWALLHDQPVIFHGDPHSGNIYILPDGSLGFLDMGLIFDLTESDRQLTRQLFLAIYAGNVDKVLQLLLPYANLDKTAEAQLRAEITDYCRKLSDKNITTYFTDMISICLKFEFCPPDFLFCMAKAFLCLNGINTFTNNAITGHDLLRAHVSDFLFRRSLKDVLHLSKSGLTILPKLLSNISDQPENATLSMFSVAGEISDDLKNTLDNAEEALKLIRLCF